MSIYFKKSREFGELILNSEKGLELAKAREKYNNCEESVRKMEEFNAYQLDVNESISKNILNNEEKKMAMRNVADLADELKRDSTIGGLVDSENEFNSFVNQLMDIIKATITGTTEEESSGCSGGGCSK
jgi:cell fate (sporulation/competence/biofilm development) regulator YlbF (YheA/YmcA/DUF963 family)